MGESATDGAEDFVRFNLNLQAGLQFKGPSISPLPPRYHQVYKYFKTLTALQLTGMYPVIVTVTEYYHPAVK